MADKTVWEKINEAKADLVKRAEALKKQAFIEMPGGQMAPAGEPAAGGVPPEMAGAMPPGGAPVDPAAGAMPPDAAAAGVDPTMLAAMGGGAPLGVDAATAGVLGGAGAGAPVDAGAAGAGGAVAGAAGAGTPEPTITISLSQLWDVVTKVLGLAKKIGANGQGVAAEGAAPAAPAAPAGQDAIKAAVIEALGDMGLTR